MEIQTRIGKLSYYSNRKIDIGGFSTVYVGLFDDVKPAAIKRILKDNVEESNVKQEVQLMVRADDHPNILRYLACESDHLFWYIGTELCVGSLFELIEGDEKHPVKCLKSRIGDEKEILVQITKGLAYLHGFEIIHRDIKPNNILVFAPESDLIRPVMKLADFGLSKVLNAGKTHVSMSTRNPNGALGWLAPELCGTVSEQSYGFKVDIFPLGCVFGYTLTGGKHPFGDPHTRQHRITKKKRMLLDQSDLISKVNNPDKAFELIGKMVEMEPAKRPTAKEILDHTFFTQINEITIAATTSEEHYQNVIIGNQLEEIGSLIDLESAADGTSDRPLLGMGDGAVADFNQTVADNDIIDNEIKAIEVQYAWMSTAKRLANQIYDIMVQKHPEYYWMAVVFPGEDDPLVVYSDSDPQQAFIHHNACGGKYHVMVFRTKELPTNFPNKDSPNFIEPVKKAFNWAQKRYNTPAGVLDEAKRIYREIHDYYQIIVETDQPVDWAATGFSFFKDTIGSYYVFLIEVP